MLVFPDFNQGIILASGSGLCAVMAQDQPNGGTMAAYVAVCAVMLYAAQKGALEGENGLSSLNVGPGI